MAEMTIDEAMGRALAHYQAGQLPQAEQLCRLVLSSKPDHAEAVNLMGIQAFLGGRSDVALQLFRRAVLLSPGRSEFQCNLGNALLARNQFEAAIDAYQKVLAVSPNLAAIHTNIGNAYFNLGQPDLAVAAHQNAIRIDPKLAEAHTNLGHIFSDQGKIDQAIESHRSALALKPDFPEVHWNLALCLLVQGDFEAGWSEFEWRRKCADHRDARPDFSPPMWDGSDLDGKTILLTSEQGLGDTLQFIRYAQLVKERGGEVVVECQPELIPLLAQLPCVSRWIGRGEPLPVFDVWHPLMSLPALFRTTLETIPMQPTLRAPSDRVEKFSRLILENAGRMKIGIAWAGRAQHKNDRNRSLPFSALMPLLERSSAQFFSLQKGPAARQIGQFSSGLKLVDLTEELVDFADTAGLIANLDLVICVDTAVAHLAGAMGKPVWLMLPFAPDWRWMLDRDDSPWYPSVRLFRQLRAGDWGGVVGRIKAELQEIAGPD
jgi:Flp pilus assembly protein TadD